MFKINKVPESEWVNIIELSASYTNNVVAGLEAENARSKLLLALSKLRSKYGESSDICATMADYTDDFMVREKLYYEAYIYALYEKSERNMSLVSGSVCDFFLELNQADGGVKLLIWASIFASHLEKYSDEYTDEIYKCLKSKGLL